ncbi:MAG TPA: hypothetical protein VF026_27680 [Ktedonobacteraceae bacterium]
MSKKILLLGLSDSVLADAQQQLARPDLEVFRETSVEDVRSQLSRTNIDHVFMGGGIPSEPRLQMEMVWAIFQSSDTTTVHMKSHIPRSDGMLWPGSITHRLM